MKANEKTPILHILHFRLCLGVNVSLALIISVEEIDLEILIISIVCISCAIMGAVAQIFRNQAAGYNSYIAIFLSYLFVFSVTFYLNYRIYDKEFALECFERAGYQDRDNDGYLENQYNEEVYLSILVDASDETKYRTASIISESLNDAGIRATVDAVDKMTMQYKIDKYEYNIFIATATINERHDLRPLLHSSYGNPAGYSDEKVNEYTERLISNISVEDKKIVVNRLEEKLKEDLPYYPIVCKSYGLMSINEFDGDLAPVFNNIYSNSEEWRIEKNLEKN